MAKVDSTPLPPKVTDLTGHRYGHWIVLEFAGLDSRRKALWYCQCDCGTVRAVSRSGLRSKVSSNCGCVRRAKTISRNTTHGLSTLPEYYVWSGMLARCHNHSEVGYPDYGGRGITVCKEWKSFEPFYRDMGPRPTPQHSIERIDNSLGYSKDNCKWATRGEQARNTRRNRLITFRGKTQCVAAWAQDLGIKRGTLYARLYCYKWAVERALTTPVHGRHTPAGIV